MRTSPPLRRTALRAQRVALKSNALYDLTLSPNLGLELRLARRTTLNLEFTGSVLRKIPYSWATACATYSSHPKCAGGWTDTPSSTISSA